MSKPYAPTVTATSTHGKRAPKLIVTTLTLALSSACVVGHTATATTKKAKGVTKTVTKVIQPTAEEKFQQCTNVADNALRLACYDKIAVNPVTVNINEQKAPLDLAKTVAVSLEAGKAVPILADTTHQTDEVATASATRTAQTTKKNLKTENTNNKTETLFVKESDKKQDKDSQILQNVGVSQTDVEKYTPLSMLYDLDTNDPKGTFTLRPHQPMYALPLWYSANPNQRPSSPTHDVPKEYPDLQNLDSKMQISFKTKLLQDVFHTNADVWFGYTQQSYWQVYNESESRPFRGSDYQPEFFITQPVTAKLPNQGKLRMLGAGLVHQSNGQSDPLSRSWNRGYVMGGMEWGKLTVVPRLWFIFPDFKDDADNKDIGDYMGYGDVRWLYNLGERRTLGGMMRLNPFEGKGAVQLDYAYPIIGGMKAYVQLFHGYGENIQDYNHKDTNVGLGLMFNDFLGL